MKKMIGGAIAIILGLICFSIFPQAFFTLFAGIIPIILLIAGCLTIYLKYESKQYECGEATDCQNRSGFTETQLPDPPPKTLPATGATPEEIEPDETESKEDETKEAKPAEMKLSDTDPEKNITDKPAEDAPQLKGNTGTLIFHSSDCQYSKSKKCTAVFSTKEKAIEEGYKPCGTCNP
ncbi:MAG: hypothetical protein HOG03_11935 [Desulfobacula sp.]|jgi:hypothetical protein|uniref:DUF308 domain-containing protein n=1 Tax=Desulfobacula sp. TaxID=2593537 RepID=UPI001DD02FA3|nr:hypothetical protein [Desulfobacula sp.]MBT3486559.1 hypothetical protein [Desulfobacula sp.]MBT3805293.1 hypothetical protein [Desulfobacula sp.]MBT4025645.1 hypothetical protein [Desulfobacula sp.]MBT4197542.1 hypothetical protein [Desulfobacula sp.]